MIIVTKVLELKTQKEFEIINITDKINKIVSKSRVKNGFINVFSKHTTLAIEINEYEKLLLKDFSWILKKLVPEKRKYFHDNINLRKNCPSDEPKNAKGHLRSLLMESFQITPVLESKLQLGKYQQFFAVETSGPRKREIIIQIFGE
ncbi:MAG TPA: secondary thiamine-phosphate synthase enzyme YjbQ [bacterium]|nr:secondary thiamine-phosphate synthase enzyme YjbQ [bacterium]HPL95723.1 secondary thiamine-phosphate synthase enzyme YjbQ [bacterium]